MLSDMEEDMEIDYDSTFVLPNWTQPEDGGDADTEIYDLLNESQRKLFSQTVGKCTPKWIRYSAKNKNRIRCVHPDCEAKKDLNFTYAGIMKHIIDIHTSQETAVRNFFPLSTVDYGN